MENPEDLPKELGVSSREIAEKCSAFTMKMIDHVGAGGTLPNSTSIEFVKTQFSYDELVYLGINYISEKAHKMLRSPEMLKHMMQVAMEQAERQRKGM